MSRFSFLFASVFCALSLASPGTLSADDSYVEYTYTASETEGELQIGVTHRLWIPAGVKKIRGIIVHQHGCGAGSCKGSRRAAYDLHWQALARKWDCALLGPSYQQAETQNCRLWCDPRNGSADVFLQALEQLATDSGHPEVATVPWCLWGHSGGGFWSSLMQTMYPERIVAIWFQSGTAFGYWESGEVEKPEIPELAMQIPMIANPGVRERSDKRFHKAWDGNLAMFKAYRAAGAPIAFTPDPNTGHETGDSRYLAIPFFDACLSLRLPEEVGGKLKPIDQTLGWLCDLEGSGVSSASDYKGDVKLANWLPGETFAQQWSEFVTTGGVSDTTRPPAPTEIASVETKDGVKLTWNAVADFESGIQSFVILRDDKEIGRLPQKHPRRAYRNLFQGKNYGDAPADPIPAMEFVDPAGTADSRYRVLSVNSVGLSSE